MSNPVLLLCTYFWSRGNAACRRPASRGCRPTARSCRGCAGAKAKPGRSGRAGSPPGKLCAGEARSRSGRGSAEPSSAAACMRFGFKLGRHRPPPHIRSPCARGLCFALRPIYTMGRWPGQIAQFGSPLQPPKAHSTTRVQKGRSSGCGGVRAPWLSSTSCACSAAQTVHASTLAVQRSGARDLARGAPYGWVRL
jgi:hypothetical protein